jgi:hypothetical protein
MNRHTRVSPRYQLSLVALLVALLLAVLSPASPPESAHAADPTPTPTQSTHGGGGQPDTG